MDTDRCREFVVLAQTCNYLQAAELLFISQSSLSKHIKSLERELGVELFDRSTRRVQLTSQGRVFLPFARRLAETSRDATVALADMHDNTQHVLDIGSIPVMVPYGITAVLHRFENTYPNIRIRITEGEADQLRELLRKKKLDLAFIREWDGDVDHDDTDEEFETIIFAEDELVAILPSAHPLANRPLIRLSELATESFLLLPEGTVMSALVTDACAVEGFVPDVRYRGSRAENIIDLVERGMGVSLLMQKPAAYLSHKAVAVVNLEHPIVTKVKLCRLRDREPSAEAQLFLDGLSMGAGA